MNNKKKMIPVQYKNHLMAATKIIFFYSTKLGGVHFFIFLLFYIFLVYYYLHFIPYLYFIMNKVVEIFSGKPLETDQEKITRELIEQGISDTSDYIHSIIET
jgi:hypothetical protein